MTWYVYEALLKRLYRAILGRGSSFLLADPGLSLQALYAPPEIGNKTINPAGNAPHVPEIRCSLFVGMGSLGHICLLFMFAAHFRTTSSKTLTAAVKLRWRSRTRAKSASTASASDAKSLGANGFSPLANAA